MLVRELRSVRPLWRDIALRLTCRLSLMESRDRSGCYTRVSRRSWLASMWVEWHRTIDACLSLGSLSRLSAAPLPAASRETATKSSCTGYCLTCQSADRLSNAGCHTCLTSNRKARCPGTASRLCVLRCGSGCWFICRLKVRKSHRRFSLMRKSTGCRRWRTN